MDALNFGRILLAGVATSGLAASPAIAQSAAPSVAQSAPPADNADVQNNGDIVITAQKREERLQKVPISVAVLSGERLDRSSAQGVTEALSQVPGVSAFEHSQGGGTFVSIRGVSASGPVFAGTSPIAYYLDTIPFGLVQTAIAPDSSAFDLQRVEVLRGPQGTLYGANAQAGVVRVLTHPADLENFELKGRGSLADTKYGDESYRGDLAINVPLIEGKLAVRGVMGYQKVGGWIDTPRGDNINDGKIQNYRLKVNAQPTDRFSLEGTVWLSRSDFGGINAANEQRTHDATIDESYSIDYDAFGAKAAYQFDRAALTSMTSYLRYKVKSTLDFLLIHLPLETDFDADVFSEEVALNSTGNGPWRWSLGTIYRNGKDVNFNEIPAIITLGYTNKSKSYAVYGEIGRKFGSRFELTVGGRYFHDRVVSKEDPVAPPANPPTYYNEEKTFKAFSPRVVGTFYPSEKLTVYASYSQGFRSGTPQPFYVTGGQGGFAAVRPDTLHNYETGMKGDLLGGLVSFDAALYYMKWTDVQQQLTVPFGSVVVTALVNAPSASGIGADLAISLRPIAGLTLNAGGGWNSLEVDRNVLSAGTVLFAKGDRLNFSPKYTVNGSADYRFRLSNTLDGHFSLSANYTSPQAFRTIVGGLQRIAPGKGITSLNARIGVETRSGWSFALFGDNLTNEDGPLYGSPFAAVPMPDSDVRPRPRTIGLQADFSFRR